MPIIFNWKTGEILSKPNYTPEQIFQLQAAMVRHWAKTHQDVLASQEALEEYLQKCKDARKSK